MPVVLIWEPHEPDNPYGHAALQTNNYHISFWPDGNVKDLGFVKAARSGVAASLVLHHNRDLYLEGRRLPKQYPIDNVTDEDIDAIYEEFLRYNNVNPDDVTKSEAQEMINRGDFPEISLAETKYTFKCKRILRQKPGRKSWLDKLFDGDDRPFYHFSQSCTSFCYHLIELADPKPNMSLIPGCVANFADPWNQVDEAELTVPCFETIVQRNYLSTQPQSESCCLS